MRVNSYLIRVSLSFLLLADLGLLAQSRQWSFKQLNDRAELSQNSVICIAQDQLGFMWFGTRDGLNKYDGSNVTIYRNEKNNPSSISNNDITDILVSDSGNIWVATYSGLNQYNYNKDLFSNYYYRDEGTGELTHSSVLSLFQSSNGDIWIGTNDGLNIYNPTNRSFSQFYHGFHGEDSVALGKIRDIYQDSRGTFWLATTNGLKRAELKGDKIQLEPIITATWNCQVITEDKSGDLWIGTLNHGLVRYKVKYNEFTVFSERDYKNKITNNDVRTLAVEGETLWAGTYKGLTRIDLREMQIDQIYADREKMNGLSKNTIKSLYVDKKGSLWVGTYYGGVNFLDKSNANFINYTAYGNNKGLSYSVVSSMVSNDKDDIFIGTEGGGVNKLDLKKGEISQLDLGVNNVKSLCLDEDLLLVGSHTEGLKVINIQTGTSRHYQANGSNSGLSSNKVYDIVKAGNGRYWIATLAGGLNLFDQKRGSFVQITHRKDNPTSLFDNRVRTLMLDKFGNLWVGTINGLNFLSRDQIKAGDYSFKYYEEFSDSLKKNDIHEIFEDSQGDIWVGTNHSGLFLYDREADEFLPYSVLDDDTSPVIRAVLEDDNGLLWISTNEGIIRLNPRSGESKLFDQSDGLHSREFNNNAALKAGQRLYFGGISGITSFDPGNFHVNTYSPPIVLTDLKLLNRSVRPGGGTNVLDRNISQTSKIRLDYDQSIFTIEFSMPNYVSSENNTYAYRLVGLENRWNYTASNTATYTIQNAGKYVFEVRGANNDGIWNDQITRLQIEVSPAPWKSWWAFCLYGLTVAIAVYLYAIVIKSRSKLQHDLQLEHMENEKERSLNELKLQFFTNISHDFRTPLTLILGPLQEVISQYSGSNKLYAKLKVIEKNALKMHQLVSQLMDFRKFEANQMELRAAKGNVVNFLREIAISFRQYAVTQQIDLEFIAESENIELYYDRDKMERVLYNLLSNAIKFTPSKGKVTLQVSEHKNIVKITVSDTGQGISSAFRDRIFDSYFEVAPDMKRKFNHGTGMGLPIAKGIVELHRGKIKLKSQEGKGSQFFILMRKGKAHLSDNQIIKNFKPSDHLSHYINQSLDAQQPLSDKLDLIQARDSAEKETILIIEDNRDVREYLVRLFNLEYKVEEAVDGAEGLEKAMRLVPDLIISDAMMPRIEGPELCARIKSELKTSHIPFVLLTARTSLIYKFQGLESGADAYVTKPFNVKELELKVRNLLDSARRIKDQFKKGELSGITDDKLSSIDEQLMQQAISIVEENIGNELFDLTMFGEELGVSRTMLFTKIKAWTDLTPKDFILSLRMKKAAFLLEQNKVNVSRVSREVGYRDPKYFTKCFKKFHGISPREFANKFNAEKIDSKL